MASAKKGFGQSQERTRPAKDFLLAFGKRLAEDDPAAVESFVEVNLEKLNEDLLEALPKVFTQLTTGKYSSRQEQNAALFGNFGNFIRKTPLGNRALNLELSIAVYQLVLKVFTRESFPENWAMAQMHLGIAYSNRMQGNRADNLEQAITHYEKTLQVFTHEAFPENWAMTQMHLGVAYSNRIRGDRANNLEQAIAHHEDALRIHTRELFPKKWAGIQINLGSTYGYRIRGDRADNLEQAIAHCENALRIFTCEAFPEDWARIQMNLGNTYGYRIRGDRADNLEQATTHYENALQIFTREAFSEDWARTQQNLANVYRESIQDNPLDNLTLAIQTHKKAAEVFTRFAYPYDWVSNQSDLAAAFTQRAAFTEAQPSQDLTQAIGLLTDALDVASPGSPNYIDAHYRLGTALSRHYELTKDSTNLDQALAAYKTALDAISPDHYDRNKIWQALPTTQSVLGSRLVRDGQWQEGLQLLLNSVSQLRNSDDRLAHASALYETGRAYETLSDWENARTYYRDALRLYKHLDHLNGLAKSYTGLGTTLVSQGYLEKGLASFQKAHDLYKQLQQPAKLTEVDTLYQIAQRTLLNSQEIEISA